MKIKIFNNNSLIDSQFEINEKIGTGGFGEIYKVTGNYDTEAVIKFGDDQLVTEYSMYNILSKIIPKNIPKCYEYGKCMFNNQKYYYIIIEYINMSLCDQKNSLHNFISKENIIPIYMNIFNELIDIINIIHQYGFIHKDIKPSNILIKQVNGIYIPVLIDFGLLDTVIHINKNQIYYAGTRCYSSIYQHFGLPATPIDDFINLVYTFMKVFNIILNENRLPWDCDFIRQDKKKHEFYAYEKWKYQQCYDKNNFFDKILNYLYSLPHFWTTYIPVKKLYYVDPLHKYTFDIHDIKYPSHWKKLIKQESISKQQEISEQLKNIVEIDNIIKYIKQRLDTTTTVNITDYSLIFMKYMMDQYNASVNYMWNNLKSITEIFMNKAPTNICTYMYNWLESINKSINKEIKTFDNIMSSIHSYQCNEIFNFFNYKRIQDILKVAINKLPEPKIMYEKPYGKDYIEFYQNIINIYNRDI